jgi:hypothetical protein
LEELVPEVKESMGLGDQLDPAAGEAPTSRRRPRQQWRRERGSGVKKLALRAVHPDAPLFIWTNRKAGLSGLSLDRIFRPPDNPAQKWPGLFGLELLCSGNLKQKLTCVHGEKYL